MPRNFSPLAPSTPDQFVAPPIGQSIFEGVTEGIASGVQASSAIKNKQAEKERLEAIAKQLFKALLAEGVNRQSAMLAMMEAVRGGIPKATEFLNNSAKIAADLREMAADLAFRKGEVTQQGIETENLPKKLGLANESTQAGTAATLLGNQKLEEELPFAGPQAAAGVAGTEATTGKVIEETAQLSPRTEIARGLLGVKQTEAANKVERAGDQPHVIDENGDKVLSRDEALKFQERITAQLRKEDAQNAEIKGERMSPEEFTAERDRRYTDAVDFFKRGGGTLGHDFMRDRDKTRDTFEPPGAVPAPAESTRVAGGPTLENAPAAIQTQAIESEIEERIKQGSEITDIQGLLDYYKTQYPQADFESLLKKYGGQ